MDHQFFSANENSTYHQSAAARNTKYCGLALMKPQNIAYKAVFDASWIDGAAGAARTGSTVFPTAVAPPTGQRA
jgi:hypothetical protein